jgi:integrase
VGRIKGGWRVRFYDGAGERQQINVVGLNQRQAENFARHCGVLNATKISNSGDIERQTALWLHGLGQSLYDKLAAVGLVEPRTSSALGPFLRNYVVGRPDVKDSTIRKMQSAVNLLIEFFGENRGLRTIGKTDADGFRAFLVRSGQADNTVRRYCGLAKQFFRAALRAKLVEENAFGDQVAAVRGNPAKFHYVTTADAEKILAACPDVQWRMIFALCRWGGLRCPSEVLALKWEDIAWQERRFTVTSSKTEHHGKGVRIVPLFPELAAVLTEGFEQAVEAIDARGGAAGRQTVSGPVITRYRDSTQNLRTTFQKILARAGLKPWPKLLQNLRSTRETELAESFPLHAVTAWLGNSQLVAAKHYLQLRDEHFQRAAAGSETSPVAPPVAPQACETGKTGAKRKNKTREKTSVFRGSADSFASLPLARMGDEGLEQPPGNPAETGVSSTSSPTSSPTVTRENLIGALQVLSSLSSEQLAAVLLAVVQPQAGR